VPIIKEAASLRNIGVGLRHIAGSRGLIVDHGGFAERFFDQAYDVVQLDRLTFAQIKDFKRSPFKIDCVYDSLDGVINEGKVPADGAVSIDFDWFFVGNKAGEFVDGEIGALP